MRYLPAFSFAVCVLALGVDGAWSSRNSEEQGVLLGKHPHRRALEKERIAQSEARQRQLDAEKLKAKHASVGHKVPYFKNKKQKMKNMADVANRVKDKDLELDGTDVKTPVDDASQTSRILIGVGTAAVWAAGLFYYFKSSGSKLEGLTGDQSSKQAVSNIVNMYVGVGLWGLPYSIYLGGFIALPMLAVLVTLCCLSSWELVKMQASGASVRLGDTVIVTRMHDEDEDDDSESQGNVNDREFETNISGSLVSAPAYDNGLISNIHTRNSTGFIAGAQFAEEKEHIESKQESEDYSSPDVQMTIPKQAVRRTDIESYLDIVNMQWGGIGRVISMLFLATEYFGTSILLFLTLWDITSRIFSIAVAEAAVLTVAMLFPFTMKSDWSSLAFINAFSIFVLIVSVALVASSVFSSPESFSKLSGPTAGGGVLPTGGNVILCLGLQMAGLAGGTPSLPSIYHQAKDKQNFVRNALFPGLLSVGALMILMAFFGYSAYGEETEVMVIDNMVVNENWGFLSAFLIGGATFATTPPFIAMSSDLLITTYFGKRVVPENTQLIVRVGLFMLLAAASWILIEMLYDILEVTGLLCATVNAFIVPFGLSLHHFFETDPWYAKLYKGSIILVSFGVIATYLSIFATTDGVEN